MISERNYRLPELDGLRGIAILLVLTWHYNFNKSSPVGSALNSLMILNWSGVDLFFVLSGFLIGGILLDNRLSENYWSTFYLRRMCRIFPLYFAVLAVFLALSALNPACISWLLDTEIPSLSYASFTQNFEMGYRSSFGANFMGPTWSLAVEEQFYLILPLIVRYAVPKALPWILVFLIACAPLCRIIAFHWFSETHFLTSYVYTPCRMDALLLGVLCAWAIRNKVASRFLSENKSVLSSLLTVLAAGMGLMWWKSWHSFAHPMILFGFSWVAAFYSALMLLAITSERGIIKSALRNSTLGRVGNIAFGIYLLHMPMAGLAHGIIFGREPMIDDAESMLVTVLALFLSFLVPYISWRFFEKPFTDVGHRFKYENEATASSSTGDHRYTIGADL